MNRDNFDNPIKKKNFFSSLTKTQKLLLLILLPIAGFSVLPIIFILLIGLLPTITVMITDAGNSNKLTIVGCLNIAGATIYIFDIINQFGFDGENSLSGDVFHLIIMLGFAGVGLLLYKELPNLFVFLSKASVQKQLHKIEEKLEKISETWGEDIVNKNLPKNP